ncbi:bacteriocin [Bombella sp. TMW 2.2543]|uniref:Bacteriocin n=1 Tax=Bombella pluederhausensis TaxID=2967336 RepID=A0ABT3WP39_9PROT|nr:bacteriocin [Bombella pluederhausensis]MCX5618551.1 bacteriocin [Bombella pluederhausensis]
MRTLNEHELNQVSGGCLLLEAVSALGATLLGGLLNSGGGHTMAQNLAGAQADMAEHGTPLPRPVKKGLDSALQKGAGFLEALTHDVAGHISAGIRDVADLLGRLF